MKLAALFVALLVTGCAATPEQMAQQSNWDVCRFTMGGPHAGVAERERQRRSLDCGPLYPAIAAKMQAENQAVTNFLNATRPQPVYLPRQPTNCRTVYSGNVANTQCY